MVQIGPHRQRYYCCPFAMSGMIYEIFSQFAAVFLATELSCSVQTSKQSNLIVLTEHNVWRNRLCVSSFPCYLNSRGVLPHITMHQHHVCPLRETESVSGTRRGGWHGINFWKLDYLRLPHVMSFASIVLSDYQFGQWYTNRCLRSPKVLKSDRSSCCKSTILGDQCGTWKNNLFAV